MKANFDQLMQQAQAMQEQMKKAQEELTELQVIGMSGGGLVKITVNGRHDVSKVQIDNGLVTDGDKEMIEDLVAAAFNDAVRKIEENSRQKIASLANGIKMPKDLTDLFGEAK